MDSKQSARRPIDPANSETEPAKDSDAQPAGRIVHDARGNAVWKWAGTGSGDPAHISLDSTSSMLRRLELPGLKVEGQGEAPPASSAQPAHIKNAQSTSAAPTPDVSHGYNPYDQHCAVRKPTKPKGPVGRGKP